MLLDSFSINNNLPLGQTGQNFVFLYRELSTCFNKIKIYSSVVLIELSGLWKFQHFNNQRKFWTENKIVSSWGEDEWLLQRCRLQGHLTW